MKTQNFTFVIINPKKFFGLLKSLDSKGMDYFIEMNSSDNTIKFVASKNDGSIIFINTFDLSDFIAPISGEMQFTKIIFKFDFESKVQESLDYIIKNFKTLNLTLDVFDKGVYTTVIKLYSQDGNLNMNFPVESSNWDDIKSIQEKLKLLPAKKDKSLLDFSIPFYIIKKNFHNPGNDLWLYLFNKTQGQTIVFSDDYYNLQILGEFTAREKEFSVQINSLHLKYLDNAEYNVQVFTNYIVFSSNVKNSIFFISISNYNKETSHE